MTGDQAPRDIIPSEKLASIELDQKAFRLIEGAKGSLATNWDFQRALSEYYFGQLSYGYRVLPARPRTVGIWRG